MEKWKELSKREIMETLENRPELLDLFALLVSMDDESREQAMQMIKNRI